MKLGSTPAGTRLEGIGLRGKVFGVGVLVAMLVAPMVAAQHSPRAAQSRAQAGPAGERSLGQWLTRMHEASRQRSYAGTFVVSSSSGAMSSSRMWHVCEGEQQIERVETLTGAPRSTFRHNDQVITFFPATKVVQWEQRQSVRQFPDLQAARNTRLADYYAIRVLGRDRVAGLDTDVLLLEPRDALRYGYRVWVDTQTGLLVKLQTLDPDGRTLEQSAFTDLQWDAKLSREKLLEMMRNTQGYRVEHVEPTQTSADAEGWVMKPAVAGFELMSCVRRPVSTTTPRAAVTPVQWIFSDGLASVSVFAEPLERNANKQEISFSIGATRLLSRPIRDSQVTVVGEVPLKALELFFLSVERAR